MKDSLHEQLSALVDDELIGSEHELLFRRIEQDEEIYQRLARYQLISDALQHHLPERVDPAFSLRVKRLLRAEPAFRGYPRLAALTRPIASLAVAASVAVVAVVSLQETGPDVSEQEISAPEESVAALPAPGGYLRVRDEVPAAVDRKLDSYLVNHNEYAVNRGMQGMLPYVRLVGHEMSPSVHD